jgi:hypothetical protein
MFKIFYNLVLRQVLKFIHVTLEVSYVCLDQDLMLKNLVEIWKESSLEAEGCEPNERMIMVSKLTSWLDLG